MRKKKEMIGNFKNPGTGWERQPQLVMDHDFRSDAKGHGRPLWHLRSGAESGFRGGGDQL
ncbi:MAG: hypothetical protein DMG50_08165 [Acidobacteria bacterium]|nr:MAG: hypothetical protein DMG50_08165 [Acidobacteriota bacterium]